MHDLVILACGSMGNFAYVLLCAVILLGVGSVVWVANLCLALTLNTFAQQLGHFVFTLGCAAGGALLYVRAQSAATHSFGWLLAAVLAVPSIVIGHFIYLMVLRRRQRERRSA